MAVPSAEPRPATNSERPLSDAFANGTKALAAAIASSSAFTLAGGGDTVSAINVFKIEDKVGYISTAGGAFLEFLEGKRLPAVDILESRFKD